MTEIYALTGPDGEVRYIGKANDAKRRLKSHLRDARRRNTPVCQWIRELVASGTLPGLILLLVCDDWQMHERRLIAEYRAKCPRLLNLAEGGNQPLISPEVAKELGRKLATIRDKRKWRLMKALGENLKKGYANERTKARMRARPDLFGQWADLLATPGREASPSATASAKARA